MEAERERKHTHTHTHETHEHIAEGGEKHLEDSEGEENSTHDAKAILQGLTLFSHPDIHVVLSRHQQSQHFLL
jgi:hypothetical protein